MNNQKQVISEVKAMLKLRAIRTPSVQELKMIMESVCNINEIDLTTEEKQNVFMELASHYKL